MAWIVPGCPSNTDLPPDSSVDRPSPDAPPSFDLGADMTVDLPPDVSFDVGPDSTFDVGPDTTFDVGPDTTFDVGPDTTFDVGPDTTIDWQIAIIGGDAGAVTTVAGSSLAGSADGLAPLDAFDNPVNVALDENGDIYLTDFNNGMVRRVTLAGEVSTVVDQPNFKRPFGITFTPSGALYVQTDYNDLGLKDDDVTGTIWRVDREQRQASVMARNLGRPRGLAAADSNVLVMADDRHHVLQLLDLRGMQVLPLAGARDTPGFADGSGAAARFHKPYDLDRLPDGRLVLSDYANHAIRAVSLTGVVTTLAGSAIPGWVDGPAAQARFYQPQGIATDAAGNIFVTQRDIGVVRRLSAGGLVTTIAGDGTEGFADHATDPLQARFYGAEGIAALLNGALLFVADGNGGSPLPYHRLRRIELGGDVCRDIPCSGQGTCQITDGSPGCLCLPGFHADGLLCVPD